MAETKFNRLYPVEGSYGNVTHSIQVIDNPVMIQIKGMQRCDYLIVEYSFGDECDYTWQPLSLCKTPCCGCPGVYEIQYPVNTFFLNIPNRYRFVLRSTIEERDTDPNAFDEVEIIAKYLSKSVDISSYM